MDITLSTELIDIYRQEVVERSRRLAKAAITLRERALDPAEVADLVRDAHTIKGSSRVVGLGELPPRPDSSRMFGSATRAPTCR